MFIKWLINPKGGNDFTPMKLESKKRLDLRPWKGGQVIITPRFKKHVGWCDLAETLNSEKFKELVCSIVTGNCWVTPPVSKVMTIPSC